MKRIASIIIAIFLFLSPLAVTANSLSPARPEDMNTSGWTIVALDERLPSVMTGATTSVAFHVLRGGHASAPVEGAIVVFTLRRAGSDGAFAEIARATSDPAWYVVELIFDRLGIWEWSASVHNAGSVNPQVTFLPSLTVVESADGLPATPRTTPVSGEPAYLRISDDQLNPWDVGIPAGYKLLFVNESHYPVWILIDGAVLEGANPVAPGMTAMWYSNTPGKFLVSAVPAPGFEVGSIVVSGEG